MIPDGGETESKAALPAPQPFSLDSPVKVMRGRGQSEEVSPRKRLASQGMGVEKKTSI